MKRGRKGSGKNTEGTFSRSFRAALIEIRIPLQILKVKIINDIILCMTYSNFLNENCMITLIT